MNNEKIIFLLCLLTLYSITFAQLTKENLTYNKAVITINDSSKNIVPTDTLFWHKITFDNYRDSTKSFIKRKKSGPKYPNPYGPTSIYKFYVKYPDTTLLKIFTLDSLFIEKKLFLTEGKYELDTCKLSKKGGVYYIYFKNGKMIFMDKFLLVK